MSHPFRFVPPSATERLLGRPPAVVVESIGINIYKALNRTIGRPDDRKKLEQLIEKRQEIKELISQLNLKPSEKIILEMPTKEDFPVDNNERARMSFQQIEVEFKDQPQFRKVLEKIQELQKLQQSILIPEKRRVFEQESESAATPAESRVKPKTTTAAKRGMSPKVLFQDPEEEEEEVVEVEKTSPSPKPVVQTVEPPAKTMVHTTLVEPKPVVQTVEPPTVDSSSERAVRAMASAINNLLQRALVPVLDSLGGVAFALGRDDIRTFMVWEEPSEKRPGSRELPTDRLRIIDEKDPELKTVAYLIQRYEPLLGATFLNTYLQQAMRALETQGKKMAEDAAAKKMDALIGDGCFDFGKDLHYPFPNLPDSEALQLLRNLDPAIRRGNRQIEDQIAQLEAAQQAAEVLKLTDAEARFAPAWAFSVLNNSVFRAVVSPAMLAAFEMAHNQVQTFPGCSTFTLKELLCSKETMNQFVFLAARHYMRDISVLAPLGGGGAGRRKGGNYINVNQARKELQERAFVISVWFERVHAVTNPLLAKFDAYRESLRNVNAVDLGNGIVARYPLDRDFEARMNLYRAALPQRELRHRGY